MSPPIMIGGGGAGVSIHEGGEVFLVRSAASHTEPRQFNF